MSSEALLLFIIVLITFVFNLSETITPPPPLSHSHCVRCRSLYRPVLQFFRALVQPEYSAVTDVYVLMFLADTVDFIIIVFGFWAFGVKFN